MRRGTCRSHSIEELIQGVPFGQKDLNTMAGFWRSEAIDPGLHSMRNMKFLEAMPSASGPAVTCSRSVGRDSPQEEVVGIDRELPARGMSSA